MSQTLGCRSKLIQNSPLQIYCIFISPETGSPETKKKYTKNVNVYMTALIAHISESRHFVVFTPLDNCYIHVHINYSRPNGIVLPRNCRSSTSIKYSDWGADPMGRRMQPSPTSVRVGLAGRLAYVYVRNCLRNWLSGMQKCSAFVQGLIRSQR